MRYSDYDESSVRVRPNKKGTRPRTKDRPAYDKAVIGRIITVDRGRYTAILDEDTAQERIVIAARARELRRQAIVPGDLVALVGDTSGKPDTLARLVRIQERKTLPRRAADDTDATERVVVANVDKLVIVVAAAEPRTTHRLCGSRAGGRLRCGHFPGTVRDQGRCERPGRIFETL